MDQVCCPAAAPECKYIRDYRGVVYTRLKAVAAEYVDVGVHQGPGFGGGRWCSTQMNNNTTTTTTTTTTTANNNNHKAVSLHCKCAPYLLHMSHSHTHSHTYGGVAQLGVSVSVSWPSA